MNICKSRACNKPIKARGWCNTHYEKWRKRNFVPCSVTDCETISWAKNLCCKHYHRMRLHGNTELPPKPKSQYLNPADYKLQRSYGITISKRDEMLQSQQGRCAICRIDISAKSAANVDHDHFTGKVRELLCSNCNVALGLFIDSPNLLRAAADYLDLHNTTTEQ